MKILLAVDGSPYTKKMLAYMTTHEELTAGTHAYSAITVQSALPPAPAALGKETVDAYYAEESAKVLDPCVNSWPATTSSPRIAKVGPAGEAIAKEAVEGKYDLIIMGTHGHGALGKLVMGSVSTQVLANCDVPVMLIR
jgi:nucleotide-binding universal stress UspA family protein